MRWVVLAIGVIAVLLGGLWLLQGLGVVTIDPILCAGDCKPLEGPSVGWTITGFLVLAAGALAIGYGIDRIRRPRK